MLVLRWLIGIGAVVALAVFALIVTVGKGFDVFRSGASPQDITRDVLTVSVPALLLGMLASAFLPQTRWLMHSVAVFVIAAAAGCVTIIRTNTGEGLLYLSFFGLWVLYYGLTLWAR